MTLETVWSVFSTSALTGISLCPCRDH